ncbi:hypothetical protein Adt_18353 [Abeliophyllum distichum]|uniref:Uncharacterized protein n=1 Tax=Abeliophyllum distichum TaxID=126358 RepID=A0ABD1TJF0_9LAMI
MVGFHFTKIHVFKVRSGRVVDEKPWLASMGPVPESTVPLEVEVVDEVPSVLSSTNVVSVPIKVVGDSSSLSSGSTAPAPVVGVLSVVEIRDDSPSPSPIVDVGSGSSSSFSVMEGEGQRNVRGCEVGPKGVPKKKLPEEGVDADSGGAKKSRAVPAQETSGSD